jgi:hypothetical protein
VGVREPKLQHFKLSSLSRVLLTHTHSLSGLWSVASARKQIRTQLNDEYEFFSYKFFNEKKGSCGNFTGMYLGGVIRMTTGTLTIVIGAFPGFPQSLQTISGESLQIRPRPCLSASSGIHYLPINLPCGATLLATSLSQTEITK